MRATSYIGVEVRMGAGGSAGAAAAYEISGQYEEHPFVDEAAALAAGKTQEEIDE